MLSSISACRKRLLVVIALLAIFCGVRVIFSDGDSVGIVCIKDKNVFEFLPTCTHEQVERNAKQLRKRGGISKATRCPAEPYLIKQFTNIPLNRQNNITFIEVGCNKATDAVMMLRMFTRQPEIDLKLWLDKADFVKKPACPIDWDLWNRIKKLKKPAFNYRHYCIEPIRENFEVVRRTSEELGYNRMGLSVHQVAISNSDYPSTFKFPEVFGKSGIETYGIHKAYENVDLKEKNKGTFYEVKLTSVDRFVRDEGISNVDILKIDTEGNDALVILGSVRTLSILRPRYITFENHGIGHWKKANLKETIDLLDGLAYTCFWALNDGFLVRITSCWESSYEYKGWSNIACYDRNNKETAEALESYAL